MRKRTMIWKSLFAFVLASVVVTSCIDDPEPAALNALPDVFIQKMVQDSVEKYAVVFWVLGNKELESVTVEGPEGETWTLEHDESNNRVFNLYPDMEDYSDSIPAIGDYTFTVTSTQTDENPITITDELEDAELGIVMIDTVSFDNSKLKTVWESLDDAEGYYFRLYDDSDKLIYMSPQVDEDETEFSFGLSDQGWVDSSNKGEDGETYRLELLAILYESGISSNKDYHVQCISIASTEIVWGE